MAIHTELPIYKATYELLQMATALIKNFPRSIKVSIGAAIHEACVRVVLLVAKANAALDKAPHLGELLERLSEAELLIRLSKDMKFISIPQYASAILLTESIGKQANGWKKASATPAAQQASLL
jgi:hypothetical protein